MPTLKNIKKSTYTETKFKINSIMISIQAIKQTKNKVTANKNVQQ